MTQEEIIKLVTGKDGFIGNVMNIPHDRQDKTHELVMEYNQTSPSDVKRQQDLLRQILDTEKFLKPNLHFLGYRLNRMSVYVLEDQLWHLSQQ